LTKPERTPGGSETSVEVESDRSGNPPARATSDWVGLGEASRVLGISHGTLRRWADEGRVAVFITPGGHRRFSRRTLRSILPAPRSRRPSLERLGASPDRMVRAYRPARAHHAIADVSRPWLEALVDSDRDDFRARGRAIVSALLAHLDAADPDGEKARLQEACQLAAEHGRRVAELGASMTDAVETFLRFRSPFVAELAGIARQRVLDTREATELLIAAEGAMDRLLVATMTGHALASRPTRRSRRPGPPDRPA
jgi:excisionase family DNA binding protein